jgi:hypothetical protein
VLQGLLAGLRRQSGAAAFHQQLNHLSSFNEFVQQLPHRQGYHIWV